MRVIGLRHGQSAFNLLGLCNDDPARSVDLTARGVAQAEEAARHLAGEAIDAVFASPLLRAQRTAQVVAAQFGVEIVEEARLADIRSGFDGLPVAAYFAAIAHDPVGARAPGGESLRDYQHRVDGFLDSLVQRDFQCVLLVAHEETLRMFDAYFNRCALADVVGKPFANCEPYFFQSDSAN